jgi:hypothetical protein
MYRATLFLVTILVSSWTTQSAIAIDGVRGAASKMHWNYGRNSRQSMVTARPAYRAAAPVIVQQPAPSAIAQTPNGDRRFSYEPQPSATSPGGCGSVTVESAPAATAQAPTNSNRRYSYDPALPTFDGSASRAATGGNYRGSRPSVRGAASKLHWNYAH